MGNWRWISYAYFMVIAYTSTYIIKGAEERGTFQVNGKKKYTRYGCVLYFVAWLILVMFVTLRNPELFYHNDYVTSTDIWSYIHFFEIGVRPELDFSRIIRFSSLEPMFFVISSAIRIFTDNYHVMWFFMYGIMSACHLFYLSRTCDKNTDYNIWVMWFSVYLHYTVGMRSGLALGFGLVAFVNYREKKYGWYMFWSLFAILSQYSIIFMVGGPLLCRFIKNIAKRSKYLLAILVVIVVCLWNYAFNLISQIMENTKFHMYTDGSSLSLRGQLVIFLCGILALLFYTKIRNKYPQKLIYVHLTVLNMIFVPFIMRYGGYRINDYYLMFRLPVWETVKQMMDRKCVFGKVHVGNFIATIVTFLWLTKSIYDLHANGLMPIYWEWF